MMRLHPCRIVGIAVGYALARLVHTRRLFRFIGAGVVLATLTHFLQLKLEIHKLPDEAGIRVDDVPSLPADVQGGLEGYLMLHHKVRANTRSASGNASPAVNEYFATFGQGVLDKICCVHKMATEILPRHIVYLEYFVFELAFE